MEKILSRLLPIQWLFASYAFITGLLAFYFSSAQDVFSIHILPRFIILAWLIVWYFLNNKLSRRKWQFINMLLPVSVLGSFYYETQFLNQFLTTFRDPFLIAIDQWLFGFQPSIAFSERFPFFWMVETMSMAYFSYYFITFGFCLYLFFSRSRHLDRLVFIVISSFLLFYSFFILFPAAGPQFYFSRNQSALPEGGIFQMAVQLVQSMGEGPTAAFPSSHVGMSLIVLLLSYKYARSVFYVVLPLFILLCFSTIYIKAHYAIDVIVAFIAAPVVYISSETMWGFFENSLNRKRIGADSKIVIKEVESREDLDDFINLPSQLHHDHKSWTPSLLMDDWILFDPAKNPVYMHCSTIRLLAFRDEKPVGRILGIIHHEYNRLHSENNARFSFLEVPDDYEVFKSLIEQVEQWARNNGCDELVGPFGFSDKDPQGFVIEGFDELTVMFANGSFPFLPGMMERYGFKDFTRLVQYKLPVNNDTLERLKLFSDRALRSGRYSVKEFTRSKDIRPYVNSVFELMNDTYASIYGYSAVTKKEADDFANRFLPILNPRLVKMVLNEKGEVIAFILAMPNLAEGLKKSGGKLLPLGWFDLFMSFRKSRELVLLLGAIHSDERDRGVDTILGTSLIKSAMNLGFKKIDSHLILEDNFKMRREIERVKDFSLYKRYCIYSKSLLS